MCVRGSAARNCDERGCPLQSQLTRWPEGAAIFLLCMDSAAAIVVADLHKSYGDVEAVRGISFSVRRGTTTALLGGNGAGKTTTLSMLLGVLTPTAGRVTVLGA